ncbi:hypothetical protein [Streptomyces violaceusniger]|uniref:hypothetical protein n=1 Tax=Streptomyces violaceusniger TaxID=68280 RepID=UPI003829AFA8
MKLADFLADHAEILGEPQTRHLRGKLRELRFSLHRREQRITYWLRPRSAHRDADRVPQDPHARNRRGRSCTCGPAAVRSRTPSREQP